MKFIKYISFAGLILTLVPSLLVFADKITFEQHKLLALVGTLLWIATAPFWINKKQKNQ